MNLIKYLVLGCVVLVWAGNIQAQQNKPQRKWADLSIPEVDRKDVICFALYTVHDNTLKLTAQLYPLTQDDSQTVRLEVEKDGKWTEVAKTNVIQPGWTAPFRVEDWDDTQTRKYRVLHVHDHLGFVKMVRALSSFVL